MFAFTRWLTRTPQAAPPRPAAGPSSTTHRPDSAAAGPRLLVLSASVGAGHVRAAQAVDLALRQVAPNAYVRCIDVLELTNAAFRRIYGKGYLDLVNRAPQV